MCADYVGKAADYALGPRGDIIEALDYRLLGRKVRQSHEAGINGLSGVSGILTTNGGITFTGDGAYNVVELERTDIVVCRDRWHIGETRSQQRRFYARQYVITSRNDFVFT